MPNASRYVQGPCFFAERSAKVNSSSLLWFRCFDLYWFRLWSTNETVQPGLGSSLLHSTVCGIYDWPTWALPWECRCASLYCGFETVITDALHANKSKVLPAVKRLVMQPKLRTGHDLLVLQSAIAMHHTAFSVYVLCTGIMPTRKFARCSA